MLLPLPAKIGGKYRKLAGKSDIKSKFAGHLLDDVQLDGGRIFLVVVETAITLFKMFCFNKKCLVWTNLVTHPSFPPMLRTCRTYQSLNTPSSPSCPGKSLLLCHVLALLPLRASGGRCHDVTSALHARHVGPCPETWSDWLGNLLCLLSSYFPWDLLFVAKVQQKFETAMLLLGKDNKDSFRTAIHRTHVIH